MSWSDSEPEDVPRVLRTFNGTKVPFQLLINEYVPPDSDEEREKEKARAREALAAAEEEPENEVDEAPDSAPEPVESAPPPKVETIPTSIQTQPTQPTPVEPVAPVKKPPVELPPFAQLSPADRTTVLERVPAEMWAQINAKAEPDKPSDSFGVDSIKPPSEYSREEGKFPPAPVAPKTEKQIRQELEKMYQAEKARRTAMVLIDGELFPPKGATDFSNQPFLLVFDKPVNPAEILPFVRIVPRPRSGRGRGEPVPLRLLAPAEIESHPILGPRTLGLPAKTWAALRPQEDLPDGAAVDVTVQARMPAARGAGIYEDISWTFNTSPGFVLKAVNTTANEDDSAPVDVSFTYPVGPAKWTPRITLGEDGACPAGSWSIIDAETMRYTLNDGAAWQHSSQYTVHVPEGCACVHGIRTREAAKITFDTELVQIIDYRPFPGTQNEEGTYMRIPNTAVFLAHFSQKINPDDMLRAIKAGKEGFLFNTNFPLRLVSREELAALRAPEPLPKYTSLPARAGHWIAFRPADPLPTGTSVRLTLGPKLPSAEGALTSMATTHVIVQTLPPFNLMAPSFMNEVALRVPFNCPLPVAEGKPRWLPTVTPGPPAGATLSWALADDNYTLHCTSSLPWQNATMYRVTLPAEAESIYSEQPYDGYQAAAREVSSAQMVIATVAVKDSGDPYQGAEASIVVRFSLMRGNILPGVSASVSKMLGSTPHEMREATLEEIQALAAGASAWGPAVEALRDPKRHAVLRPVTPFPVNGTITVKIGPNLQCAEGAVTSSSETSVTLKIAPEFEVEDYRKHVDAQQPDLRFSFTHPLKFDEKGVPVWVPVATPPLPAGRWAASDNNGITFYPQGEYLKSTLYRFEFPEGATSAYGSAPKVRLIGEVRSNPITLTTHIFERGTGRTIGGSTSVLLVFDQSINPPAVLPFITAFTPGTLRNTNYPLTLVPIHDVSTIGRYADQIRANMKSCICVRPQQPLPEDETVTFQVTEGVPSREGELCSDDPVKFTVSVSSGFSGSVTNGATLLGQQTFHIQFNQPLPAQEGSIIPVWVPNCSPALPAGTWTVHDDRLTFSPSADYQLSTEYLLTFPPGAVSSHNETPAKPEIGTVSTATVGVADMVGIADHWLGTRAPFLVRFDQKVHASDVAPLITASTPGTLRTARYDLRPASDAEVNAVPALRAAFAAPDFAGCWVAMAPVAPFPSETEVTIKVAAGVPSALGPLLSTQDITRVFTTGKPLEVTNVSFEHLTDDLVTSLVVRVNGSVNPAVWRPSVAPELPTGAWSNEGPVFRYKPREFPAWRLATEYVFSWTPDMATESGEKPVGTEMCTITTRTAAPVKLMAEGASKNVYSTRLAFLVAFNQRVNPTVVAPLITASTPGTLRSTKYELRLATPAEISGFPDIAAELSRPPETGRMGTYVSLRSTNHGYDMRQYIPSVEDYAKCCVVLVPVNPLPSQTNIVLKVPAAPPSLEGPAVAETTGDGPSMEITTAQDFSVESISPESVIEGMSPRIVFAFTQPVPLTTDEQGLQHPVWTPVFEPKPRSGLWTVQSASVLTFESNRDAWDNAHEYKVSLPENARSVSGDRADGWMRVLKTPSVNVTNYFMDTPRDLNTSYHRTSPCLVIQFDQRVNPTEILPCLRAESVGRLRNTAQALALVPAAEVAEMKDPRVVSMRAAAELKDMWMVVRPVEPFPFDATVEIKVGPNMPSAEGPVLSDYSATWRFTICPEFKVTSVDKEAMSGGVPCVRFSHPHLSPLPTAGFDLKNTQVEQGNSMFQVGGAVVDWTIYNDGQATIWGQPRAPLSGSSTYSVTIPDTVTSGCGQRLSAPHTFTFNTRTMMVEQHFPQAEQQSRASGYVFIRFTQRAIPARIAEAIKVSVSGTRGSSNMVPVDNSTLRPVDMPAALVRSLPLDAQWVVLQHTKELAPGVTVTIKIENNVAASAEGPLPMTSGYTYNYKTAPFITSTSTDTPTFEDFHPCAGLPQPLAEGDWDPMREPGRYVRVFFSDDLSVGELDRALLAISPDVPGAWVATGHYLTFTPTVAYPLAQKMRFVLSNLVSRFGDVLTTPIQFEFPSQTNTVSATWPRDGASMVRLRSPIVMLFAQPVDPARVLRNITVLVAPKGKSKGKPFAGTLAVSAFDQFPNEKAMQEFAKYGPNAMVFCTSAALPTDAEITVQLKVCESTLGPAVNQRAFEFSFHTATEFQLMNPTVIGQIGSEVHEYMRLDFNHPIVRSQTTPVAWQPAAAPNLPAGLWKAVQARAMGYEVTGGRWPMGTPFTITLPAGLESALDVPLVKAVSKTFHTPTARLLFTLPQNNETIGSNQVFMCMFNQRIDFGGMLRNINFFVGETPEKKGFFRRAPKAYGSARQMTLVDLQRAGLNDPRLEQWQGYYLAFRCESDLPFNEAVYLQIGHIPSAEGALLTQETNTLSYATPPPFTIEDWDTKMVKQIIQGTQLDLRFTNLIDVGTFNATTSIRLEGEPPVAYSVECKQDRILIYGIRPSTGWHNAKTEYKLVISNLRDAWGHPLQEPVRSFSLMPRDFDFSITPDSKLPMITYDPQALASRKPPTYKVNTLNLTSVRVLLYKLTPGADLENWLATPTEAWAFYAAAAGTKPPKKGLPKDYGLPEPVRDFEFSVDNFIPDTEVESNIIMTGGLSDAGGGWVGHVGVVVLPTTTAMFPMEHRFSHALHVCRSYVQCTRLGVDVVQDLDRVLVWATDLIDGGPIPGVDITAIGAPAETTGRTDANGVALVPFPEKAHYVVASRGPDMVVITEKAMAVVKTKFGATSLVWHTLDDRNLYRPGDKLTLKGYVRLWKREPNERIERRVIPDEYKLKWACRDARSAEVASGECQLNRWGGFDMVIELPKSMNLGEGSVTIELPTEILPDIPLTGRAHEHAFKVEEFVRPEFKADVTTKSPLDNIKVGGEAWLRVKAGYYAGGALADSEVTWTVNSKPGYFSPPGFSDWDFGDTKDKEGIPSDAKLEYTKNASLAGLTREKGDHDVKVRFAGEGAPAYPVAVTARAEVLDVNRRSVVADTKMTLHGSAYYVGLRKRGAFAVRDAFYYVDVVVTDPAGAIKEGVKVYVSYTFTAGQLSSHQAYAPGQGHAMSCQTLEVTSGAPYATIDLKPQQTGTVTLRATVLDDAAKVATSTLVTFDVQEPIVPVAPLAPEPKAKTVAVIIKALDEAATEEKATVTVDKDEYLPDEPANISITAPWPGADGLLVVIVHGVVFTQRFTLKDVTGTLALPLQQDWVPNVAVRVLLAGRSPREVVGDLPAGMAPPMGPAIAAGSVNVNIRRTRSKLELEVLPDELEVDPGGQTAMSVRVKNWGGALQTGAEVALIVVDEAALTLADYKVGDIVKSLIPSRTNINPTLLRYSVRKQIERKPWRQPPPDTITHTYVLPPPAHPDPIGWEQYVSYKRSYPNSKPYLESMMGTMQSPSAPQPLPELWTGADTALIEGSMPNIAPKPQRPRVIIAPVIPYNDYSGLDMRRIGEEESDEEGNDDDDGGMRMEEEANYGPMSNSISRQSEQNERMVMFDSLSESKLSSRDMMISGGGGGGGASRGGRAPGTAPPQRRKAAEKEEETSRSKRSVNKDSAPMLSRSSSRNMASAAAPTSTASFGSAMYETPMMQAMPSSATMAPMPMAPSASFAMAPPPPPSAGAGPPPPPPSMAYGAPAPAPPMRSSAMARGPMPSKPSPAPAAKMRRMSNEKAKKSKSSSNKKMDMDMSSMDDSISYGDMAKEEAEAAPLMDYGGPVDESLDVFAAADMPEMAPAEMPEEPQEPPPVVSLRQNFNALAFFSPGQPTDGQGMVRFNVSMPDNLTKYRIIAVGVSGDGSMFGTGEGVITAKMPLVVRCSAPRFLNYNDECELTVVVQNLTAGDRNVRVAIRAVAPCLVLVDGNATLVENGFEGLVPKDGRRAFSFRARAVGVGKAILGVSCVSRGFGDGSEISFPIRAPPTTRAMALYGRLTSESKALLQPFTLPENLIPGFGAFEFSVTSTLMQGLVDAAAYLLEYPFDSVEATASYLIALAGITPAAAALGGKRIPAQKFIKENVNNKLKRLAKLQLSNGGFPMYSARTGVNDFVTCHVAHCIAICQEAGYSIPGSMAKQVGEWLKTYTAPCNYRMANNTTEYMRLYGLYVLERLRPGTTVATALAFCNNNTLEILPLECMGWVLSIFASTVGVNDRASWLSKAVKSTESKGQVDQAATHCAWMVRYLSSLAVSEEGHNARFETFYPEEERAAVLHSAVRTDAVLLDAFVLADPTNELVPMLARGLLDRRRDGHWEGTQENCWVAVALQRYFAVIEKDEPNYKVNAWLGAVNCGETEFKGRDATTFYVRVPMPDVERAVAGASYNDGEVAFILSKKGKGTMYYKMSLNVAPRDPIMPPFSSGFAVVRRYSSVANNPSCKPDDVVEVAPNVWRVRKGALVGVTVTVATDSPRFNVAAVDAMPAGLEHPNKPVPGIDPVTWCEHENRRDDRTEWFAGKMAAGQVTSYYVVRAVTPGRFMVPPARAEEQYTPELCGHSCTDQLEIV